MKESCWIEGKPYFTRRAIGEFLEYGHPDRAIHKITERHSHIDQFSVLVNLTSTDGKIYEQRVYDPIGLQLIINKSDKPQAVKFQIIVAHLVLAIMQGKLVPSRWSRRGDLTSALKQLLSHPPNKDRRQVVADIARREGKCLNAIYTLVEKSGNRLLTKSGKPRKRRSDAGPNRPDEFQALIEYKKEHPDAQGAEIKANLGLSYSYSSINLLLRTYC